MLQLTDNTQTPPEGLYEEALDAARDELQELAGHIAHLQDLLDRLQARKSTVEQICRAISRWVEVNGSPVEEAFPEDQDNGHVDGLVALTEEEVTLLAYSHGRAGFQQPT